MLAWLVTYVSIGCGPSSVSDTASEPNITPTREILTHSLKVIADPEHAANFLFNPDPIGARDFVHGRTVTIDVLPQPGWTLGEWVGPVFAVDGRSARIIMGSSQTVIVSEGSPDDN